MAPPAASVDPGFGADVEAGSSPGPQPAVRSVPAMPAPAAETTLATTRSGLSRRIRGAHAAGDVSPSLIRGAEEPVLADVDVLDFFAGYGRGDGEDR